VLPLRESDDLDVLVRRAAEARGVALGEDLGVLRVPRRTSRPTPITDELRENRSN
jgi:hypothetical protein